MSIGLPVYNGERFLTRALDSVLGQTFGDLELIVSNNASTDGTADILAAYAASDSRLRVFENHRNLGAARNYNITFDHARGQYFKWASHDDAIAPTFVERCVDVLDRNPQVSLAFCDFEYIDQHDRPIRPARNLAIQGEAPSDRIRKLVDHQLNGQDIYWAIFGMTRSDILRRTSLIEAYVASDQTLLFNLLLLGDLVTIGEPLFFRREHDEESMVRHMTARDRARWFDSGSRGSRPLLPNWRLLREHLNLLAPIELGSEEYARCMVQVMRRFGGKWRAMGGELAEVGRSLVPVAGT